MKNYIDYSNIVLINTILGWILLVALGVIVIMIKAKENEK